MTFTILDRRFRIVDMVNKLKIVEQEADESICWLELLAESGTVSEQAASSLVKEGNGLVAMTVASIKTLRARLNCQS
jgi:four helix bundle protein